MKKIDTIKDLEDILERLDSKDWKTREMAVKELLKVAQQIPDEKKEKVYFAFLRCLDWENDTVSNSWRQYFGAITKNVFPSERFIAHSPLNAYLNSYRDLLRNAAEGYAWLFTFTTDDKHKMSESLAKLFLDDFSRAPSACEEYIKEMEPFITKGKRENLVKSVEIMKETQKRAEIIAGDILSALVILGKRGDTKSQKSV